jgi:hypothetical protein
MSPLPKLRLPLAPAPLLLPVVVVREFIRSTDQPIVCEEVLFLNSDSPTFRQRTLFSR